MGSFVRWHVFNWKIRQFSLFCGESIDSGSISTSFKVLGPRETTWQIDLFPYVKTEKIVKYHFRRLRTETKSIEDYTVSAHFRIHCDDTKGNCLYDSSILHKFNFCDTTGTINFTEVPEISDLEKNCSTLDSFNIKCEIYVFVFYISRICPSKEIIHKGQELGISLNQRCPMKQLRILSENMQTLYNGEQESDLHIILKDCQVAAHKAILCTRSRFFSKMLNGQNLAFIEFPDIEHVVMNKLLLYIYTGKLNLSEDDYRPFDFQKCAKRFEMEEISAFFESRKVISHVETVLSYKKLKCPIESLRKSMETPTEYNPEIVFECPNGNWYLRLEFKAEQVAIFVQLREYSEVCTFCGNCTIFLADEDGQNSCKKSLKFLLPNGGAKVLYYYMDREDSIPFIHDDRSTLHCNLRYIAEVKDRNRQGHKDFTCDSKCFESLSKHFRMLFRCGDYSNVVLMAGPKKFRMHRVILSTRSPVFSAMFRHNTLEKETGEVIVEDVEPDVMEVLLLFVYSGQIDESFLLENTAALYYAADKYAVTSLKRLCSNSLFRNLNNKSVCETLIVADMHVDKDLKTISMLYLFSKFKEISQTEEWNELKTHHSRIATEFCNNFRFSIPQD